MAAAQKRRKTEPWNLPGASEQRQKKALLSAHAVTLTRRVYYAVAVHLPKYTQTMGFNLILKIWS